MTDNSGAARNPGHYYAQGDPPGTQRYWNGTAWEGGPQPVGGAVGGGGGLGAEADYKGLIGTLFDFEVTSFVTPKIIKVIYIIMVVLICLGGVAFLLAALASGGAGILVGLIFVPLFTLLYLLLARIYVEVTMVAFRTYDEVKKMSR